jgi:ANTAR domain
MGLLDSLMQGGPDRDDDQDFVNRYDQGPPYAGISDDEAIGRYQQVASELSPEVYQQSAQDALSRMAPEERAQFGQLLQQRAQQHGVDMPGLGQARGEQPAQRRNHCPGHGAPGRPVAGRPGAPLTVEQAKGVVMGREQLDAQAAFERLRGAARSSTRRLADVAKEVTDGQSLPTNRRKLARVRAG